MLSLMSYCNRICPIVVIQPPRHTDNKKNLIFNKSKFDRLDSFNNLELEIKVGRGDLDKKTTLD
jgi:hypothetical protein